MYRTIEVDEIHVRTGLKGRNNIRHIKSAGRKLRRRSFKGVDREHEIRTSQPSLSWLREAG